jgi:hypothetical protein
MKFIEGVQLSNLCDYSFGDVEGIIHRIPGAFCIDIYNKSFVDFLNNYQKEYMTIFIGNSRVNELLVYLKKFDKKFIIFCNLEDTPILDDTHDLIPENVLSINSANALSYGEKIFALPYGLQRKFHEHDNRIDVLKNFYTSKIEPSNLLYVNHSVGTNPDARSGINEFFKNYSWSFVRSDRINYISYIEEIKDYKFMICPIGHAMDCHRNWEVLYMRRVPVMIRNNYLTHLFKDYPVLFVDSWEEVDENLLMQNIHLYDRIQSMDLSNLDIVNMYSNCVKRHYA